MIEITWGGRAKKNEITARISRKQQQIRLGVCYRPRSAVEAFQADEPDAKTHIRLRLVLALALPYCRTSIKTRRLARSRGAGYANQSRRR